MMGYGLRYGLGWKGPPDPALAVVWLELARAHGETRADPLWTELRAQVTDAQVTAARTALRRDLWAHGIFDILE